MKSVLCSDYMFCLINWKHNLNPLQSLSHSYVVCWSSTQSSLVTTDSFNFSFIIPNIEHCKRSLLKNILQNSLESVAGAEVRIYRWGGGDMSRVIIIGPWSASAEWVHQLNTLSHRLHWSWPWAGAAVTSEQYHDQSLQCVPWPVPLHPRLLHSLLHCASDWRVWSHQVSPHSTLFSG